MNEEVLVKGIEKLIKNNDIKKSFNKNLKKEKLGTEEEINKFYEII